MNARKTPTTKIDYETVCFEAKCILHHMSTGDKNNIINEVETFLLTIWLDELKRILLRRILSTQWWAYYYKLWDTCLDNLMFPRRMHIASYETVLERIQEITNDLNSYMMNRATPYLEAWSSLKNNESSNHHIQPRMGTPT